MPALIVIYGAPFAGKTTTAWRLARSLAGKTAVVSTDQLGGGSIAVSDPNALGELEMVHLQLRLLTANYLKNGYNVVAEGPFCFERDGVLLDFQAEIDQLVALMRHLARVSLVVRLTAGESTLHSRAAAAGKSEEGAAALRVAAAYRQRDDAGLVSLDSRLPPDDLVAAIKAALPADV